MDYFPSITNGKIKYWMVGCKKCETDKFYVYSDGSNMMAKCCNCGDEKIMPPILYSQPDKQEPKFIDDKNK